MKLNSIVSYFILLAILSGCTFDNKKKTNLSQKQKDESIESLISLHKTDALFLDFWFGMNKNQYEKVLQLLKQKKIITGGYVFYKEDGTSYTADLSPIFVNDSLVKLNLIFPFEVVYEVIVSGKPIHYHKIKEMDYTLMLYQKKYKNFNKKSLDKGIVEYEIIENNKLITIHIKSTEITLNANEPIYYSKFNWLNEDLKNTNDYFYNLEETKKEREKKRENIIKTSKYERSHPIYVKRTEYNEFFITYTNYQYHLNVINSLAKQKVIKNERIKIEVLQKKAKEQRLRDSLQSRTFDNI